MKRINKCWLILLVVMLLATVVVVYQYHQAQKTPEYAGVFVQEEERNQG